MQPQFLDMVWRHNTTRSKTPLEYVEWCSSCVTVCVCTIWIIWKINVEFERAVSLKLCCWSCISMTLRVRYVYEEKFSVEILHSLCICSIFASLTFIEWKKMRFSTAHKSFSHTKHNQYLTGYCMNWPNHKLWQLWIICDVAYFWPNICNKLCEFCLVYCHILNK